jgi:glutamate---cysteine ligase / carboxylate-amine ligase
MADAEEVIRVVGALRPYVPLLIGLAANSPLWRGAPTGLMSSRVPISRAFPRVGLPPRYADWRDFERRVQAMIDAGMIEDYTFLWYDVRPHPRLGTIEVRAMDSQTHVEHTITLTALVVTLVKLLREAVAQGEPTAGPPDEIIDENRWLAARHGLAAQLYDDRSGSLRSVAELTEELLAALRPHAQELGCERELDGIGDILGAGNGGQRQQMVFEANHDLRELMAEIVAATS